MMNFSDKEIILKEFPNVKLSYGGLAHKKVYNAELYLAIQEGKKCFFDSSAIRHVSPPSPLLPHLLF